MLITLWICNNISFPTWPSSSDGRASLKKCGFDSQPWSGSIFWLLGSYTCKKNIYTSHTRVESQNPIVNQTRLTNPDVEWICWERRIVACFRTKIKVTLSWWSKLCCTAAPCSVIPIPWSALLQSLPPPPIIITAPSPPSQSHQNPMYLLLWISLLQLCCSKPAVVLYWPP